jgi:hypothetical protein
MFHAADHKALIGQGADRRGVLCKPPQGRPAVLNVSRRDAKTLQ